MLKSLNERIPETTPAAQLQVRMGKMDHNGILVMERIDEILTLCDRNHPLYEQVSSFSVVLYALGYFDCPDFMSFHDISVFEAAQILQEQFTPVDQNDISPDYRLTESGERYLLVVGDPLFPSHLALLVDNNGERPYFSKLPLFGAGYDSREELMAEFCGKEGVTPQDFRIFRKNWTAKIPPSALGRIYIVKD